MASKDAEIVRHLKIIERSTNRVLHTLQNIDKKILKIEAVIKSLTAASVIEFYVVKKGKKQKVESMFLKVTEKLPVSIVAKDKQGNVAKVDGLPKWASDEKLCTLEVAEDGMSAKVIPTGVAGLMKLQAMVDADLGEGIKEVIGELEIEFVSGEAVVVEMTAGTPEPV